MSLLQISPNRSSPYCFQIIKLKSFEIFLCDRDIVLTKAAIHGLNDYQRIGEIETMYKSCYGIALFFVFSFFVSPSHAQITPEDPLPSVPFLRPLLTVMPENPQPGDPVRIQTSQIHS